MDEGKPAGSVKSIEKVQEAERKAGLILEEAKKDKERKLRQAGEKALRIADWADSAANRIGEEILKKSEQELGQLRKRKLGEAHRGAERIKRKRPGKMHLEKLAGHAVREIIGA
jgi:vacuolar-type H+-ATPase subunit H